MNAIVPNVRSWCSQRDHWAMLCVTGIYIFSILIHFNIPTTSLGMYNVSIPLLSLGILAIYHDLLPEVWQRHKRTLLLTLALYLWLWVSAFLGGHTSTAVKYTIKYSIYFFVFPALLTLSFKFVRDRKAQIIYIFLLGLTFTISSFGIIEYFYPRLSLLIWIRDINPYTDNVNSRIMSLFDSSTKLGVMMAFGVLNAYLATTLKYLNQYISIAIGFLCLGVGILSGSRNFIFTIVSTSLLGLFPLKIFAKREVLSILLLSTLVATILWGTSPQLTTKLSKTIQDIPHNWQVLQELLSGNEKALLPGTTPPRLRIWYAATQEFRKHPLIGTGLKGFTCDVTGLNCDEPGGNLNAHNLPLGLLVEIGLPGMLLVGGIIISALWHSDLLDVRVGFLCSFIMTSQLLDFFIHDFVTIITMILILSVASHVSGKQLNPSL